LVVSSVASGIANMICGAAFSRQAEGGAVPVENGLKPDVMTPPKAIQLQKAMTVLGFVHLFSSAGALVLTSILNFKAGRSNRWSAVARLLP
jgi:hypothetical protein